MLLTLRPLLAEFVGTALLVTVVVGSGIAAAQLSPDVGLQLLENSIATAFGLAVLILLFGPASGAHFNPVVSLTDWLLGSTGVVRSQRRFRHSLYLRSNRWRDLRRGSRKCHVRQGCDRNLDQGSVHHRPSRW